MQQVTLGAASQQGSGVRVAFDEQHSRVVVNGRALPLGYQEAVVLIALLRQMAAHQQQGQVPPWVESRTLCRVTRIRHPDLLKKVVSEARGKVLAVGVDIKSVYGRGYFLCGLPEEG